LRKDSPDFEKRFASIKNPEEIKSEKKELTGRYVFELSDYLIELIKRKFIRLDHIEKLLKEIKEEKKFLADDLEIYRSQPKKYNFKQRSFLKCTITYPLLIYEIKGLLIKVEIIVKEKQKAIGIQPMLYLCLPLKLMKEFPQLEGQIVDSKQKASYLVDKNNFHFIIETIQIFALLSKKHHQDVVNILTTILNLKENFSY